MGMGEGALSGFYSLSASLSLLGLGLFSHRFLCFLHFVSGFCCTTIRRCSSLNVLTPNLFSGSISDTRYSFPPSPGFFLSPLSYLRIGTLSSGLFQLREMLLSTCLCCNHIFSSSGLRLILTYACPFDYFF